MAKIVAEMNQASEVKRLLRNQETHQYFSAEGWTEDPGQAQIFADVVEAAETCAKLHLDHVEVALKAAPNGPDLFCTTIR